MSSGDPASPRRVRVPGARGCLRLSAENPSLSAGLAGELACVTGAGPQAVAELSVLWEAVERVYTASFSPHQWGMVWSKENGTTLDSSEAHSTLQQKGDILALVALA